MVLNGGESKQRPDLGGIEVVLVCGASHGACGAIYRLRRSVHWQNIANGDISPELGEGSACVALGQRKWRLLVVRRWFECAGGSRTVAGIDVAASGGWHLAGVSGISGRLDWGSYLAAPRRTEPWMGWRRGRTSYWSVWAVKEREDGEGRDHGTSASVRKARSSLRERGGRRQNQGPELGWTEPEQADEIRPMWRNEQKEKGKRMGGWAVDKEGFGPDGKRRKENGLNIFLELEFEFEMISNSGGDLNTEKNQRQIK
jgi:hypothetical protein